MIIKANRVDVEMRRVVFAIKRLREKKLIQSLVIYFITYVGIYFTDDITFIFLCTKNAPQIMTGHVYSGFRGYSFVNFLKELFFCNSEQFSLHKNVPSCSWLLFNFRKVQQDISFLVDVRRTKNFFNNSTNLFSSEINT